MNDNKGWAGLAVVFLIFDVILSLAVWDQSRRIDRLCEYVVSTHPTLSEDAKRFVLGNEANCLKLIEPRK
jgi:hypothetical protein